MKRIAGNLFFAAMILMISSFFPGNVSGQKKNSPSVSASSVPFHKPWKTIVQDKDYSAAWTVSGDLDNDGIPELICTRSMHAAGENYTASAIAYTVGNKILWKWGDPKDHNTRVGSDIACQVYDWDNDGKNEVILSTQQNEKTWLVELEGATGKEKRRFQIPDGAADCFTFCNISGLPFSYPKDIIVKTRYSQLWAYNYEGKQLWTIYRPGKHSTAHQAVPFDLDQDGIDEIMTGYVMVDEKGNPMWIADQSGTSGAGHLDCVRLYHQGSAYVVEKVLHPSPALSRLVITYCNGRRISMTDGIGNLIWGIPGRHFQSVDIGKVRSDVHGKQIIVDVGADDPEENGIWILDGKGNILKILSRKESRTHRLLNWLGTDVESILISDDRALFDGYGEKVASLETPVPEGFTMPENYSILSFVGEMTGDSIPDIVLYTNPGALIWVYKNENGKKPSGKVVKGTGVNYTLY